jgi:hypothetical protein
MTATEGYLIAQNVLLPNALTGRSAARLRLFGERCEAMARHLATFRQRDVTRALRAARAAGLDVAGYEVEAATGKIIINTNIRPEPKPASDLDKWLARHAR